MKIGDFIEIEGELQKNPLINYMDIFVDLFRMADIFAEKPQLGGKTQAKAQKQQENETVKQIKSFADELKHSGTIDFILLYFRTGISSHKTPSKPVSTLSRAMI